MCFEKYDDLLYVLLMQLFRTCPFDNFPSIIVYYVPNVKNIL